MTKKVLVSIIGSQFADSQSDSIELVTVANYYKRNGHHFLTYEEMPEGEESLVRNTLKFDKTFFEMTKKGGVNTQMLFRSGSANSTYYSTPAGPMTVNITTLEYTLLEEETYMEIHIRYVLDINFNYSSENEILIRIAAQE